ncbi:MAG: hypothetical protein KJ044_15580, partial [Planctomycetes bacterium]|nr:hypothetical protein [Planctomycetota bacterium]
MNTPARHRTFRAAPLAALALAFCLAAQARAQDFAALETIYLNDHLKAHDLDTFAGALIRDVINPRPASAEAWLALQRLMDIRRDLGDQAPLYAMLQRHADADFAACGVHADSFADAYLELARDHAPDALWHAVARRRAGLTAAAWIGPFAEAGAPAHDDVFAPEAAHDMAGSAAGAYGRVGWRKLGPVHDLDGEIDLGTESRWMGCGYYLAFDLICGGGRTVVLKPRFNGPGKLWLNGELIANMDTRARDYARPWLTVELRRGRNLLVVKLASASPLTLRLRTPDGAVPEGVVCEAPPASTVLKLNASASRPVEPVPPELALLGLGCGATARQNAALALALAAGYAAHGLRDQAMELAQQALVTAPEEPLVRLAWLSMLSESPLHSGSERRRLESAGIAELLRQNEGLAPAWLARAALMTRDERWQEADEALSRVASLAPAWRVQLARAEVFGRAGWRAEQLGALRAAVKAAPRALPPRLALARYWNLRGHTGAQIAAERDVLALVPAHRDALASLVTALLRTGQPDEALKSAWLQAALDPYSPYAQGRLATALLACGRLDDACAVFELLASRTGRPEQYWQDAARACLQHGDATRAAGFLGRALDASPGEHGAR